MEHIAPLRGCDLGMSVLGGENHAARRTAILFSVSVLVPAF